MTNQREQRSAIISVAGSWFASNPSQFKKFLSYCKHLGYSLTQVSEVFQISNPAAPVKSQVIDWLKQCYFDKYQQACDYFKRPLTRVALTYLLDWIHNDSELDDSFAQNFNYNIVSVNFKEH